MSSIKNYPGAKNNSGILQWMINRIPYHTGYCEPFAGSAALYYKKQPALLSTLIDLNDNVMQVHRKSAYQNTRCITGDAIAYLRSLQVKKVSDLLMVNRKLFIYLDPPYPLDTRKGRKYYKHEMTDDDHIQLLQIITTIDANIMISTRQNELYDIELSEWNKEEFHTIDRGGAATEVIYMNYQAPELLHQYDMLGDDCWDRQAKKRKRQRFLDKIQELPKYERHMLIQEMIRTDAPAVKHFLSVLPEIQANSTVIPGSIDDTGCTIMKADTGIICNYCNTDPGIQPRNPVLWNGFLDQDLSVYVCSKCQTKHYHHKWQGEHKGKFSEVPVLAHTGNNNINGR